MTSVALPVPEIIGGTSQNWGVPGYAHSPFSGNFLMGFWSVGPCKCPSEQKPIKKFREKGPWAYPGTPQFLGVPPILSGTGKATDVKFGRYTYRVHPSKSPLKNFENRDRGRIQGLPNFWGYPLLSQERVKPRTSNSVSYTHLTLPTILRV